MVSVDELIIAGIGLTIILRENGVLPHSFVTLTVIVRFPVINASTQPGVCEAESVKVPYEDVHE